MFQKRSCELQAPINQSVSATFNKNDSRKQPSVSQEEDMVTAMQSFSRASSQANKGGAPQSVNNNYNQQPQNQQDNGHPEWLSPSGMHYLLHAGADIEEIDSRTTQKTQKVPF